MESITVSDKFSKEDIDVIVGDNVRADELIGFYQFFFPRRPGLPNIWEWLYRRDYSGKKVPILLKHDGIIVAHISGIVFNFKVEGVNKKGCWLMDYAVHPDYRRKGLGKMIAQELMKVTDGIFTCCNERAIHVLKGLGWKTKPSSEVHYLFVRPVQYPKIKHKIPSVFHGIIDKLSAWFFTRLFKKHASSVDALVVDPINEQNVLDFEFTGYTGDSQISTSRDKEYLKWRLLESPHHESYRIVKLKDSKQAFIVKFEKESDRNIRHINILMSSHPEDTNSYLKLACTLGLYAKKHSYHYLWVYTNDPSLSKLLKQELKSYKKDQIYAYHSDDNELMQRMNDHDHRWELIDSDFERMDYKPIP